MSTGDDSDGRGGWFELRDATDLLAKLRRDLRRVQEEPSDSFAAFDFFVTAWHLLDWLYPGRANDHVRAEVVRDEQLLAVCQHIATGAKHFRVENRHTKSVRTTGQQGTFDRTFDFTFDRVRLVLHLDGRAAEEFGATAQVSEFAGKVVAWWERKLANQE